eukprot:gnl/MRDRNA2_/MRDRNA2_30040_c0_seq1.p1 gnl/MRDRNA2_/MRDRNA2_30040_c0~~gnl/MRDRNA2_/MRDRNA2_30040_c0_seq1.p1  ORF type:complete len:244 (+),score=60.08 gnl/MRDRNA2_/MRDRNA2_30040_c0_seq1:119-850(+)
MPVSKQAKIKRFISITKRVNLHWRPAETLFKPDKVMMKTRLGQPIWENEEYDINRTTTGGLRRYKDPPAPRKPLKTDYTEEDFHEMKGKFRFAAGGIFHQNGELAEIEVFKAAMGLHLVGWLKVRAYFMAGHIQGDIFALSYFQKWLQDRHLSREAGIIAPGRLRIYEWNYGLNWDNPYWGERLEKPVYRHLVCVKDWRRYGKKKAHMTMIEKKNQVRRVERLSIEAAQEEEDFQEQYLMKNY